MDWTSPPGAPIGLEEEGRILYNWAADRGATRGQCDRIVGLLSVEWMCDLPRPPRTRRKEGVSDSHWHRFLFRRHVQRILGWKERLPEGDPAGFSDAVNLLIRTKFYPEADPNRDGEVIGGSQERCPPAKSPTIDDHATTRSGEGGCCGNRVCISPGGCDRTLGAGDGRMPAYCKPGRILPAWCTRQEQKGTGASPRESVGESRDPSRHRSQCDVERPAKRGRSVLDNGKE
jgi:hypothetical protein